MTREMKLSEARILVFLDNFNKEQRFASLISSKLDIDYCYTMQILKKMEAKRWVASKQFAVKRYYFLTDVTPLKQAKERIIK